MTEKAWYQDGFVVIVVIVLAVLFGPPVYRAFQQEQMGQFTPSYTGVVTRPLIGSNEFVVNIYHQNPGVIKNGQIKITVRSKLLNDPNGVTRSHSFESWEPNEESAVEFRFPLERFDMESKINVTIECSARNVRDYKHSSTWIGDGWAGNNN